MLDSDASLCETQAVESAMESLRVQCPGLTVEPMDVLPALKDFPYSTALSQTLDEIRAAASMVTHASEWAKDLSERGTVLDIHEVDRKALALLCDKLAQADDLMDQIKLAL